MQCCLTHAVHHSLNKAEWALCESTNMFSHQTEPALRWCCQQAWSLQAPSRGEGKSITRTASKSWCLLLCITATKKLWLFGEGAGLFGDEALPFSSPLWLGACFQSAGKLAWAKVAQTKWSAMLAAQNTRDVECTEAESVQDSGQCGEPPQEFQHL